MYIERNSHVIYFAYIKQRIVHDGSHCFKPSARSKVHSMHALALHACGVVELRVVTERKKKKNEAEVIPRALSSGA